MTHEEAQRRWLLANDGMLPAGEHAALDAHMQECAACRESVDRLAATDRALRAWGSERPPSQSRDSMPVSSRASIPRSGEGRGGRRAWPIVLAAGLAGIALGIGGSAALRPERDAPPSVSSRADTLSVAASRSRRAGDGRNTYVLLLEEPASQWPPATPLARPGYFEWMDSLQVRGEYVGGERLSEDEGRYVSTDGSALPATQRLGCANNFSGMFFVNARDYDEAVTIARGSPHLQYGGVLIRRVY